MKNVLSLIACCIICLALLQYRAINSGMAQGHKPLKITEWDAFGYYMYLPAICIYHDHKELKWLTEIDKKYGVTGGNGWQALKTDNGNYVFKYLGGVAIMQAPLFLIAHVVAKQTGYPPDGFSPPYQYALGLGIIFYCLLALLLLRKILLQYFNDITTAVTLTMLCLATNFIQYAGVDSGQSHAYLFVLYVLVLYTTMQWHSTAKIGWAALTGYIIGLATMSRPTEAIMLFIPLMWDTHTAAAASAKWKMVKDHKNHIASAMAAGFVGVLPQLIYWKSATGAFIFDVGSKWDFLSPHFRVLFGWEKGWFIYTPVTLLFVAGMFFIRKFPFRKSVLWFCLLNIYIIIGWHEWRYGGSYSTRALVQSYPLFALPFAALTDRVLATRWRIPFYLLCLYLLFVNFFQELQYNTTVLHFDDMNRKYYGRIYLNPSPTPADMSLLDNDELLSNESDLHKNTLAKTDSLQHLSFTANSNSTLLSLNNVTTNKNTRWLKIEARINAPGCLWQSYLNADLKLKNTVKHARVRLFSPISKDGKANDHVLYMSIPGLSGPATMEVYLSSANDFRGVLQHIQVSTFE